MHLRFNGAATLSLRKLMDSVDPPSKWVTLQWGRNFIVAEMRLRALRVRFSVQGFNGAATLSLRKCTASERHSPHTSMRRFNGAATLSLRKSTSRNYSTLAKSPSFNGAATLSLRKCTIFSTKDRQPSVLASMGPQLYRCGNMRRELSPRYTRFNGAAIYRCGWLRFERGMDVGASASMGPQLYRCGNTASGTILALTLQWLQWGRNFIVAEMRHHLHKSQDRPNASMGPQLYRCGNRLQLGNR